MRTFLGSLMLFLTSSLALAGPQVTERVIDLPEIAAGRWYLTLVVSELPTEADRNLLDFMATNKAMIQLKPQVVYNEWTDANPTVSKTDWATFLGSQRPALLLQAPPDETGKSQVVFFATGSNLKTSVLVRRLQDAVDTYAAKQQRPCPPGGPCPYPILPRVPLPRPAPYPQPQPQPAPQPAPVTPPPEIKPLVPTITPPLTPVEEEENGGIPLLALLIPLAAAGLGIWKSFDHS
jgi:hypothetical protein